MCMIKLQKLPKVTLGPVNYRFLEVVDDPSYTTYVSSHAPIYHNNKKKVVLNAFHKKKF